MIKKNDRFVFPDGRIWCVDYVGLSCCEHDVVTFDRPGIGKTMDRVVVDDMLASGAMSPVGQLLLL